MCKEFRTQLSGELIILLLILPVACYSNYIAEGISKFPKVTPFAQTSLEEFRESVDNLVHQSQNLTKSYQDEIGKWRMNQYDNYTLVSITNSFIPKFQYLINIAENLTYPKDYKYIHDALVNSLASETDSYRHFKNYLISGNKTEDEISTNLLSRAFQYEQIYSKFLSLPLPHSVVNITRYIAS